MTSDNAAAKVSTNQSSLVCELSARCSGCDRLHFDRAQLEEDRRRELARLELGDVPTSFVWIGAGGLRDRLEFTLEPEAGLPERMKLGLFDNERSKILDIETCPQLSPNLQRWLLDFRKDLPKLSARRSVRLRVSPQGLRGAWLDFANEDIRDLLDEGAWLSRQLAKGIRIEVGQKRKRVVENPVGPRAHRLEDAVLEPWFETPFENRSMALFGTIGTFTQPGFTATRELVRTVLEHVGPIQGRDLRVAEFGAGIGCLTLPLLAHGACVDVFESDRLALQALEKGVSAAGLDPSRLRLHAGDFILSSRAAERAFQDVVPHSPQVEFDVVVVDPPRPGVGHFIDAIDIHARRANWVYVSCYPESFAKDAKLLHAKGLRLERVTVVEQFPFTRHFEIVASFRRA